MLYFSGKGCSEFPKKVLILIGILNQTQEDAWNAAMLCANRQTFDLSVKIPGSVYITVR